jgi:hypothetical protein
MAALAPAAPRRAALGRPLVHPAFDLLLVASGFSVAWVAALVLRPELRLSLVPQGPLLLGLLLACNFAHFGASTVRLYTRRDAFQRWPFLTMGLPLVSLALLGLFLWQAELLGPHATRLYFTWSPYHYAAQTFGISMMYAFRSGCSVTPGERKLWWATALSPFLLAFVGGSDLGLQWLVPVTWLRETPWARAGMYWGIQALKLASIGLPLVLFARLWSRGRPMPLLSLLTLYSNAVWFVFLQGLEAFVLATIAHSVQYLGIILVFHVRDRMGEPGNRRGWLWHAGAFYGMSGLLGYALFGALPVGLTASGFGLVESALLSVAAINIHHFVVDAYIWRFSGGDRNRKIAEAA